MKKLGWITLCVVIVIVGILIVSLYLSNSNKYVVSEKKNVVSTSDCDSNCIKQGYSGGMCIQPSEIADAIKKKLPIADENVSIGTCGECTSGNGSCNCYCGSIPLPT